VSSARDRAEIPGGIGAESPTAVYLTAGAPT